MTAQDTQVGKSAGGKYGLKQTTELGAFPSTLGQIALAQLFLGRHKAVSWAEVRALKLAARGKNAGSVRTNPAWQKLALDPSYKDTNFGNSIILPLKTTGNIAAQLNKLGGTQKAAWVLWVGQKPATFGQLPELLTQLLAKNLPNESKSIVAINFYGSVAQNAQQLRRALKRSLKEQKKPVKLAGDLRKSFYNSATSLKVLSKNGYEFNVTEHNNLLVVSKTFWVQDFRLWQRVDIDRPFRDMRVGMLPSKLARIMLNLARLKKGDAFWDPFAGLGTTLMQAQLLGIYAFGSDVDREILKKAEENIKWLLKTGLVPEINYRLFEFDVLKNPRYNKVLRQVIRRGRFDAIVTEGYLGEPKTRVFKNKAQALAQWRKISLLYKALFKNLLPTLRVGGRLVVSLPMYKYRQNNRVKWFKPHAEFSKVRFEQISFNTGELEWVNPKSVVARRLIVLERKK